MSKFIGIMLVSFVVIWGIGYGVGDGLLIDRVIPDTGVDIDEWMNAYYFALTVSVVAGIIFSTLWYYFGCNYAGEASIKSKFYILFALSFIASVAAAFFFIMDTQEGRNLAYCTVILAAPIGYLINAYCNAADAVKYIPPFK